MESWDAIVVGSGIGGLSAAGLLAIVGRKRVLVLEKHTEPGGLTHTFRRDGAVWDVGVHYVGEMRSGTMARGLIDLLSSGNLEWNRLPHEFERFVYPGFTFTVPSDPGEYLAKLIVTFPHEKRALERYFADVHRVSSWNVGRFAARFMGGSIAKIIHFFGRKTYKMANQTTQHNLNRHFRDPRLKTLLTSQWGDYGLLPQKSSFAIHALIVTHYLHGASFPQGGSGRIARTFEATLERHGGRVLVGMDVQEILVEGNRVVGVRVIDRRGPKDVERTFSTSLVISNVGAEVTFTRLLPRRPDVAALVKPSLDALAKLPEGSSAVTLYLRLKEDPQELGIHGENVWINSTWDDESTHASTPFLEALNRVYVSFPSTKSGTAGPHTAEIVAHARWSDFEKWAGLPKGCRGTDYVQFKERISHRLLDVAEQAIPGLKKAVVYAELSTPLTVNHYTSAPEGRIYGPPAVPFADQALSDVPRTPLEGLWLSGTDAGSLGVVGALMGGAAAASRALGRGGFFRVRAAFTKGVPSGQDKIGQKSPRSRARLLVKRPLSPQVWELLYELDAPTTAAPGQFARLRVADFEFRDYSIAGLDGNRLRLLVSTATGGLGSRYVEVVSEGEMTEVELPLGRFTLSGSSRPQVFVATGTGLAPFLPMFQVLREGGQEMELLFGCRDHHDDLTRILKAELPSRTLVCLSRVPAENGQFTGRVTDALLARTWLGTETDVYVCGSAAMVADVEALLAPKSFLHVYTERY